MLCIDPLKFIESGPEVVASVFCHDASARLESSVADHGP